MEKAQGKDFEMGQNSEKELDRMSKQIQSGDEQNLELSESLRAIEKLAASKQQQAEASEKSIEDDSPEKGKKLRLLNLLQETTFDRT
jgi:hypothetical protein